MVDVALDCVVVGAGWAGLAASGELQARGIDHILFERARIGETWRTQRWGSFLLNTPRYQTVMPGDIDTSDDPDGAMQLSEFIEMLESYARRKELPIQCGRTVRSIEPCKIGFRLETDNEVLTTRSVIVATGDQNMPVIPAFASEVPIGVAQFDTTTYRDPRSLPEGAVLVVGCAQSGGQIAEDLALGGRAVFLSTSRVARIVKNYRGRHNMAWMVDTGIIDVPKSELLKSGPIPTRGLTGADHSISLQSLSALGVVLLGRLQGIEAGIARFDDSVRENIAHGDRTASDLKARIDAWLVANGREAPPAQPDPTETVAAVLSPTPIWNLDLSDGFGAIVWCTGVRGDYRFLKVPGALDDRGVPVEVGGVTRVPGFCIAGVPYSISRRSGTILAAGMDAVRMVDHIEAHLGGKKSLLGHNPGTAL